jgi:hypothetical protein
MSAMEVEKRRRLWWSIVGYDRRLGEMTGATVTAMSCGTNTRLPLNINDADLHPEHSELPQPHHGATEMLFCLSRLEFATIVTEYFEREIGKPTGDKPKPTLPEKMTIRLIGQDSPTYTLDGFCAHIEGTYVAHCDTRIPLHFLTQLVARASACRLHVLAYLVRLSHAEATTGDETERENIFMQALQMIEYDNIVQSAESIKQFKWYSLHIFPFPAYIFLLHELCYRVSGPAVDRVWQAMEINHEYREMLRNNNSPLQAAFGNLFLKAWRSYEAAANAEGKQISKPRFISMVEERVEMNRRAKAAKLPEQIVPPIMVPQTSPSSVQHTPSSYTDGSATMVTPPVGQPRAISNVGGYGAPQQMVAPGMEDTEMDWAYILSGYQDGSLFGGGLFGSMAPGGGMGGMGPGPAPGPGGMGMFGQQWRPQ